MSPYDPWQGSSSDVSSTDRPSSRPSRGTGSRSDPGLTRQPTDPAMRAGDASSERDPVDEMASEFARRLRGGERASAVAGEMARRRPDLAPVLDLVLPAVAELEGARRDGDIGVGLEGGGERGDSESGPETNSAAGFSIPKVLGDFTLERELGRGGMGLVFLAHQRSLGRQVALKVLPPSLLASGDDEIRFAREARAAARLHHPHIVPVFGVGQDRGLRYYAMQYVAGPSLAHAPIPMSWRRACLLIEQAARAVAYAHEQGVVHRDIKPGNLLMEADDKLLVADFGLAKLLEDDTSALTRSGAVLGTLQYMPPEAFDGIYDERGDQYALGVTLYELLCGRTPHSADGSPAMLGLRKADVPAPPITTRTTHQMPSDLAVVVHRAIETDPAHRYPSAAALADELGRVLRGEPITARPVPWHERLARWARRRPAIAALAAGLVTALTLAAGVGWWGYAGTTRALRQAREQEGQAIKGQLRAERERLKAQRSENQATASALRAQAQVDLCIDALEALCSGLTGDAGSAAGIEAMRPTGAPTAPDGPGRGGPMQRVRLAAMERAEATAVAVLDFWHRFSATNGEDAYPRLRRLVARAYVRTGELRANLERDKDAVDALRTGLRMLDQLIRQPLTASEIAKLDAPLRDDAVEAERRELRRWTARARLALAQLRQQTRDSGLGLLDAALADLPHDRAGQTHRDATLALRGVIQLERSRRLARANRGDADAALEDAMRAFMQLRRAPQGDGEYDPRVQVAIVARELAESYNRQRRHLDALAVADRGLDVIDGPDSKISANEMAKHRRPLLWAKYYAHDGLGDTDKRDEVRRRLRSLQSSQNTGRGTRRGPRSGRGEGPRFPRERAGDERDRRDGPREPR